LLTKDVRFTDALAPTDPDLRAYLSKATNVLGGQALAAALLARALPSVVAASRWRSCPMRPRLPREPRRSFASVVGTATRHGAVRSA